MIDIAARWEPFGSALRIPSAKLAVIKATPGSTPDSCLKSTLLEFLKKNYDFEKHGEPSWRLIVKAVARRAGGNNVELALRIAKDHPTNPGMWFLIFSIPKAHVPSSSHLLDPTSSPTGVGNSASVNRDNSILGKHSDIVLVSITHYCRSSTMSLLLMHMQGLNPCVEGYF